MTNDSVDLEKLVADIQRQLAPSAEVLHNVRLDGRNSGVKRQIDVLVRQHVGQYSISIIIDCKDYKKPIDVKSVEEFNGLLSDVGAQRGVLVCPRGFSAAAKNLAQRLQIDLYSPVDSGNHKWKARATIPALCDYRSAKISFGIKCSAPYPFRIAWDYWKVAQIHDSNGPIGTCRDLAIAKWDNGLYPIDEGEHRELSLRDGPLFMDNGYGRLVPIELPISILVERKLYYGQYPILQISGFQDHLRGGVIANAFTVGLLDPEHVTSQWRRVADTSECPVQPVLVMRGLIGWG